MNNINNSIQFSDVSEFIRWVEKQRRFSKKTSLENMQYFAGLFDHPEKKFNSIHVTGTNGKGSCVSYLKNIYLKAGYHVATFTSPYIICFNERITFDDKFISDEDLLRFGNLILSKYPLIVNDNHELPTFFEFITLLSFLYFSSLKNLDIAIIEVGIGGRLDATNIINPLISVITNVSFDHTEQLGPTLEHITIEKLGIVKQNTPLITGCKSNNLQKIMLAKCHEYNTIFKKVDYERLKIEKLGLDQSIFSYKDYDNLCINMVGFHQIENSALVIEIIEIMNELYKNKKSNLYISSEILYEGLISTTWPGRLECVSKNPLIFIDGGHNIDCINRVCEYINTLSFEKKRVIIAISDDKDKKEMIKLLDETFDEIIFTHYTYSRSATSNDLFNLSNSKNKLIIDNLEDAITYCYENVIDFSLFIGSLYLVSEIRPKILNKKKN